MLKASTILAALLVLTAAGREATAELLSSRPITVVIPFTPGASSDTLQRIVNKKVAENTGQTLVVESRPGGGGVVAATVVKQAPPDGHTLFQGNAGTHAANASLYATLPYDPIKDFRPITLLWSFPQLLAVPFDSPAKSVTELVALAKSRPAGLSFASQGTGSAGHLLGEMFKLRTGANMHVPYRS
jgi:tripartite-type tricarboxylate transporter receptor subunit TctC